MKKIICLLCAVTLLLPLAALPGAADGGFVIENGTLVSYSGNDSVINIPDTVYRIGENVFEGKTFITGVNFTDNIISIGRRAFRGCTGLTQITVPRRVTTIATDTFSGCTNLTTVVLNEYLSTIGGGAFEGCPISSITLPYSLKNIGVNAFLGNTMTRITVPSTVVAIGDFAFGHNQSIVICGVAGTRAQSFSQTFGFRFEVVSEPDPLPAPPALPDLEVPGEKLRDSSSDTETYLGSGERPAAYAVSPVNYLIRNMSIDENYYDSFKSLVTREECAYYLIHIYFNLMNQPVVTQSNAPAFADTADKFVTKARELGLVKGTDEELNLFSPNEPVTREQMSSFFIRTLNLCGISYNQWDTSYISFSDSWAISGWAAGDVYRAYHLGLINGMGDGTMAPQASITREQVFTMVYNLLTNLGRIKSLYARAAEISQPRLMYSGVGQHAQGHIDEAYYSAPSVLDINNDGRQEIISASYSLYCTDAQTGQINWKIPSGYDRSSSSELRPAGGIYSDVITKDIDGDGAVEIVIGHNISYENGEVIPSGFWRGAVAVYDSEGYYKPGWPVQMPRAVSSVAAYDLDGNGTQEIIVGLSGESAQSVWVFDCNGNVLEGWPQLSAAADAVKNTDFSQNTGYQYGLFYNNIAVGDINGDGAPEIVVPSDLPFICAYDIRGNLIKANAVYGGRSWGRVGTWENYEFEKTVENEGWGATQDWQTGLPIDLFALPRAQRNIASFTHNKALIYDVDGNGVNEVVIVGTISDRALLWPELPLYQSPFIFNGDRTRFKTDRYDWTEIPKDTGKILSTDWLEIQICAPEPLVADINLDGVNDILYPSASGQVFSFSLDRKNDWSYWVCDETTKEIASPLTVADINGDGLSEIIFTTIAAMNSGKTGSLVILDCKGQEIHKITLPPSLDAVVPNGSIARPVIKDIDGDGIAEIILNTHLSGVTVYTLKG